MYKKLELSGSIYISPARRGETPSAIMLHSSTGARNIGTSLSHIISTARILQMLHAMAGSQRTGPLSAQESEGHVNTDFNRVFKHKGKKR